MSDFGGINPYHAAAGFGGGLAYLPFARPAHKLAALGAVAAGVTTAAFLTPLVVESMQRFLQWNVSPKAELGMAFLVGLTAMTSIPIILGIFGWIKDNLAKLMQRLTGTPATPPKPPEGGE